MKRFEKNELMEMLKENTKRQPKAKYSNDVLLHMLENVDDNFSAYLETTKGGDMVNRGSLAEVIIKAYLYEVDEVSKSLAYAVDLDTRNLSEEKLKLLRGLKTSNLEIKFATSFAPATYKKNKAHFTMIVCQEGIYLIRSSQIIWTKAGKLNANNQMPSAMVRLNKLSKCLGY